MPGKSKKFFDNENVGSRGFAAAWFGPALMSAVFILVSVSIFWIVQKNMHATHKMALNQTAQSVREGITNRLDGTRDYLVLLAQERADGTLSAELFQQRTVPYIAAHPELINITWVDAGYVIRTVAPFDTNKQIVGLKLNLPEPQRVSILARYTRQPHYTRPFEAIQGKPSFEIWVPVFRGNEFLGLFAGVYSCGRLLEQVAPRYIIEENLLSIVSDSGALLGETKVSASRTKGITEQVPLDPPGNGMALRVERFDSSSQKWGLILLELLSLSLALGIAYGMWSLNRELAERKRSEKELKLKSFTLDNLAEEIIWTTPEGRIWNVNDVACKKLGYTHEELLSLFVSDIDPVFPKEAWQPHWEELKRSGSLKVESLHKTKDGHLYPVAIIANYFNLNGLEYNCAIVRDITKRMQDEEALRQSEKHYRELFENMLDGFVYCKMFFDETGRPADFVFIDVNRAFTRLTGLENVVGRNASDVFPGIKISSPESLEILGRVALTGKPETFEIYFKPLVSWLSVSAYSPQQDYFVAVFDNITEQRSLEEQLRQSQKMEAVGQLAGGIAHDFNNALTAIIGFSTLAEMKMAKDDPLRMNMEQILAAADRAANLTRSLLAFSRKQSLNPQHVNLCEIVRDMELFLGRLIGADIHLQTDFRDAFLNVYADRGQIEQVLMNLAANSRDAMPTGGALHIETTSVLIDEAFVHFHGYGDPGRYALMTVSDSGAGLDKETIKKIFEPFFTTKEIGKGTGLGLSIVYGIIKQHNGYINVYSEPEKGTAFNIYLPLIEGGSAVKKKELLPYPEGGTETVLVAEDDPFTRSVETSILKEFGYTVIEAEDGEDAVKKFLEHKDVIQILLFDMIMPNKNGKKAYEEIKSMRPEIPVLFFSGYTADFIDKKRMLEEGVEVLIKPVHPHVLARKVREILNKGNRRT